MSYRSTFCHLSLLSPPFCPKPTFGAFVFLGSKNVCRADTQKPHESASPPSSCRNLRSLKLLGCVSWRKEKGGLAREWPETRLWSRFWGLMTVGPCALAVPRDS